MSMDASYEYAQYNATSERNKPRKDRYLIFPQILDLVGIVSSNTQVFLKLLVHHLVSVAVSVFAEALFVLVNPEGGIASFHVLTFMSD